MTAPQTAAPLPGPPAAEMEIEPPLAMLAELTHRCPLRCPYCSNPTELERTSAELSTDEWRRVMTEAAALGVLQIHFSGGEPTVRHDLVELVGHASRVGLYSNLITSGVLLTPAMLAELTAAGLEHVQLSFQDVDHASGDRIAGLPGAHVLKYRAAAMIVEAGLPLTANFVVHRQNLARIDQMIAEALALGAQRVEIAHVQYYGWALANRAALLPTRAQLDRATLAVEAARTALKGRLMIDYVVPDYYARRPKACMAGWARRFLNISPAGKALPCHAAESLPLEFPSIRDHDLAWIWRSAPAFNRFRGVSWMQQPCSSCDRRAVDWGGCRCQAFALTGDLDRTDPACALSPDHGMLEAARNDAFTPPGRFVYRRIGGLAAPQPALRPEAS